jgi:Fic family protein
MIISATVPALSKPSKKRRNLSPEGRARISEAVRRPSNSEPNADQLAAILDLCAWAHAEWVRIHPFANGNGTRRASGGDYLAMRYGVPPFIRLRPRPNSSYGEARAKAMQCD